MEFNKIKRYQSGGYITYQPLPAIPQEQPQPQGQPQATENKKDEGLDQEVLKKMIGEGITTDVMQYSNQVNQAYMRYSMMDDNMKNSYMGRQLRMMMKGDLGQLTALARSKKYLDAAVETAKGQDGLNEGAITQDNQAVVKQLSTGKVTTMSLSQLAKENAKQNSDFKVLTNGELAEEREFNPQLINNSSIFSVISYAKGMDKVKEEVMKNVASIGHTSKTSASGAYGTSDNDEGLSTLEAAAANGAFKIKDGSSLTTNTPQIQAMQAKLWDTLSPGAKATLRMRAASMTSDGSQIELLAKNMAADLLSPHTTIISKEIHDETYKKMGANGAGANKVADVGAHELAFNLRSNITPINIQGPAGAHIEAIGSMLPDNVVQSADGKRSTLYSNVGLAKVAKVGTAFTANGDKVNPKNAVITGNSYIAWLPVTTTSDGTMKIDEAGAAQWAKLQKQHPGVDTETLAHTYGTSLNLRKLVVAEASSFSDHRVGWLDGRDDNYYKRLDDQTEKDVRAIVDPDGTRDTTHAKLFGGDNTAHSHLIFMDSKDAASYREADANHATLPAGVFSLNPYNTDGTPNPNAYNTGTNGANIGQGLQYQKQQTSTPLNMTSGYFK